MLEVCGLRHGCYIAREPLGLTCIVLAQKAATGLAHAHETDDGHGFL